MSQSGDLDALIEASVTAHRASDLEGRLAPPPEWFDLAPEALDELFERQLLQRDLERALDSGGRTGTARAVMEWLQRSS
jgi:hypothetical protein